MSIPLPTKLHIRIMIPFTVLFLVVTLISFLINRHYISKLMDERISEQTDRISSVLSNSVILQNPLYLNKLTDVIDGEIIIYEQTGRVISTTFADKVFAALNKKINPAGLFSVLRQSQNRVVRKVLEDKNGFYLLTARILQSLRPARVEKILCIVSPLSPVISAKSKIAYRMFWVGLFGLLLTVLVAYLISKSVTRPLNDIVSVTGSIASGDFEQKAPLSTVAELKQLASSINTMTGKLKAGKEQIVRSSRMAAAGKVTAAMAHEIRNPLSSIKMMTQLLKDRSDSGSGPEDIKIIKSLLEEIIRVEKIVNGLTDIMRPSELVLGLYDINDLIEEVLLLATPRMTHLNIKLIRNYTFALAQVKVDKDKIKQVIWNLILNAAESMPGGGAVEVITCASRDPAKFDVIIKDQGRGLDGETINQIFEPYFTTKPEGLGLGLATSRKIIESHGGKLIVANRKKGGVKAAITLLKSGVIRSLPPDNCPLD